MAILRGEEGPDAPNPYRYPEGAQQKTNSDGTTRLETEDEHGDRVVAELVKSGGPVAESATARLQAKFDANARASQAAKAAEKQWDESWLNVKKGTDADIIKGVEAALAMAGTKSPLYSTLSKFFSKATDDTNAIVAWALQASAQLTADMSTGRARAQVGTFGAPHNIQAATNSTGIFGLKNVLVVGRQHATVFSEKDTTIAADQRAHVKGTTGVELASPKEILFSTDGKVDALARTRMSLVANTGERKTPDGVTFFCNSRAGFRLETESADVDVHASENARIHAHKAGFAAFGEKRAYLGSAGFGLVATPDTLALGKLTSAADLDGAKVARHNALTIAERRAQLAIEDSSLALVPATAELASGATRIRLKRDGDAIVDVKGELRAQGRRVLLG